MNPRPPLQTVPLIVLVVGLLALPGCAGRPAGGLDLDRLTALSYPDQARGGPDLDVVVERAGSAIRLTNRTAQDYRGLQLWLNRQYVGELDELSAGGQVRLPLDRFVNRYGEPFPTGTLLAPDKRREVLSAQLYDPQAEVVYPLLVFPEDE